MEGCAFYIATPGKFVQK